MNSLIFLSCVAGGMAAGFMLGSFYERDLARIDVNYWKSMCELNTKHWQRMYDLERGHRKATEVTPSEGGRMPPPLPESEAARMAAS